MHAFHPPAYGPVFADLLAARLMPLGPGSPNRSVQSKLERLDRAFDHAAIRDADMAGCCRAAVWLYHDFLDESHAQSQEIHTPSGSYWHGILHRREPDYDNAKYWFRRVGRHPIFAALAAKAARLAPELFTAKREWDPLAFVDLCANAAGTASLVEPCRLVQQREWELLFDYCYRQAVG